MPLTDRDYDLLSLYLDDALTPTERSAVESRLAADAELRAELEALRRTIALVRTMPEMVAPRDLRLTAQQAADIVKTLRAAAPAVRTRRPIIRTLTTLAAAAASLVLVLAGTFTLLQTPARTPQTVADISETMSATDLQASGEPTLKQDNDMTTFGIIMIPEGTPTLFETGEAEFYDRQDAPNEEESPVTQSGIATATPEIMFESAQPAPVITADESGGEADAAGSSLAIEPPATRMQPPAATPTRMPERTAATDSAAGTGPNEVMRAVPLPTMPADTAPDEREADEMPGASPLAMTAVADSGEVAQTESAGQDDEAGEVESPPLVERLSADQGSPLLGFALVIVGLAVGVGAVLAWARRG